MVLGLGTSQEYGQVKQADSQTDAADKYMNACQNTHMTFSRIKTRYVRVLLARYKPAIVRDADINEITFHDFISRPVSPLIAKAVL